MKADQQKNDERLQETIGWIGMVLVQCASFPTLYMLAAGHTVSLPDLSLVLSPLTGLALYFWRPVLQLERVYLVSKAVCFAVPAAMLSASLVSLAG